jgi:hypothetical protein
MRLSRVKNRADEALLRTGTRHGFRRNPRLAERCCRFQRKSKVQRAVNLDFLSAHARIATHPDLVREAGILTLPRGNHSFANLSGCLAVLLAGDLTERHGTNLHVQINSIQERPGNAAEIVLDLARAAARFSRHFAVSCTRPT